MTVRPMTETCPKLREAIENGHLRCSVSVGVGSPVATIDTEDLWRLVHAAERSLSTSAAVRGMREALEKITEDGLWDANNPNALKSIQGLALAALSGIEGEDEQATRGEDAATAPTDR